VNDWFRSISVLGVAFAGVVTLTFGLAALIVPGAVGSAGPSGAPAPGASGDAVGVQPDGPVTAIGGTLAVSGDREGSLVLDREEVGERYALSGRDGRVTFEAGSPLAVAQISYDRLDFFVDPDECELTPGERHDATGVAGAHLICEDIEDVRDNGVVTFQGRVGVAADLLGLRGDLPESGGTVMVGEETITFDFAAMTIPGNARFAGIFAGSLFDPDTDTALTFTYDPRNHEMVLSEIGYGGGHAQVPAGACSATTSEIGLLNPHTRVAEMVIRCTAVDVPTLGAVPIEGTLVVELSEPPS
jgi:hypothetical protein